MKYDKSKIYTAFNADELKQGSKVICANKAHALRKKITDDAGSQILLRIEPENKMYRFVDSTGDRWLYAYLIEEPQEKNYRPFSSMEKAKEAIKKHGGLIKDKITGVHFFIITYSETKVVIILKPLLLQELFDNFVFCDDGTACGECTED